MEPQGMDHDAPTSPAALTSSAETMESAYNNRARVPEHPAIFARWSQDALAYRALAVDAGLALLDQPYGDNHREAFDIFSPASPLQGAPWVVFLHGGYWQAMGREAFSHVARGLNLRGFTVAIPSYPLCPHVTMASLVASARRCCAHLAAQAQGAGLVLCGHSAGGHLAALLMSDHAGEPPSEPSARAGLSLSGLFDLSPLLQTSLNASLRLDAAEALRLSPVRWRPSPLRPFVAAVGADESAEFIRQSADLSTAWRHHGADARLWVVPDANHFTLIDPLCDPDSALVSTLAALGSEPLTV
jgi:arylformamidase